jgi:hypothetical protein
MDPATDRFLKIEAIFHEVLDSPTPQRTELIASRCEGDPELAVELRAL